MSVVPLQPTGRSPRSGGIDFWIHMMDVACDALIGHDVTGRITGWSDGAQRLLGWPSRDIIGRSISEDVLSSDRRDLFLEGIKLFVATGAAPTMGSRVSGTLLHRSGRPVPAEFSVWPLPGSDPMEFLFVVTDITKLRTTEDIVRTSERRERQSMELAGLARWEWDVVTNVVTWSREMFVQLGLDEDRAEPSLEAFLSHVHPDDLDAVRGSVVGSMQRNTGFEVEHRIVRPDGVVRWIATKSTMDLDASERPVRLFGTNLDITDRRAAEEQTARLAAIVVSSQDAIVSVDIEGVVSSWNEGARSLFGYSAEEILGRPASCLSTDDTIEESKSDLERLMAGEQIPPYRSERRRSDGSTVHVSLAASPTLGRNGELLGASLIFRDMTEYERAEQALKLGLEQEREMVAQLRELDRAKQSFLASVSHELRTPLTTILGYLELILRQMIPTDLDPDVREMLDVMDISAKRLFALIEDLLVRAKIDSGNYRVAKVPVEIATIVANTRRLLASTAEASSVELDFDVGCEGATVLGDRLQLERVLVNLVSNAIKFTPTGGRVGVKVEGDDQQVRLVVSDTGIGIPEADRENIFSPFFRSAEADRKAIQGTGLGLSIAKEIVERLSGSISCESTEGVGTTMTIVLPAASHDSALAS